MCMLMDLHVHVREGHVHNCYENENIKVCISIVYSKAVTDTHTFVT
jgi:hypothetical protein